MKAARGKRLKKRCGVYVYFGGGAAGYVSKMTCEL